MLRGRILISFEYVREPKRKVATPCFPFCVIVDEFDGGFWTSSFEQLQTLQCDVDGSRPCHGDLNEVTFFYEAEDCGS